MGAFLGSDVFRLPHIVGRSFEVLAYRGIKTLTCIIKPTTNVQDVVSGHYLSVSCFFLT